MLLIIALITLGVFIFVGGKTSKIPMPLKVITGVFLALMIVGFFVIMGGGGR